MPRTKILKIADLPLGKRRIVEVNGFEVALFHVDRNIYAVTNICPHNGGSLGEGLLEGETIVCPLHFWRFDLPSGKSSNQPAYRIETYPVDIENGWIYLDLPEEDLEE